MSTVGMHEAKTRLSQLVEEALGGGDVIITRRGEEVVRLVAIQRQSRFGDIRGAGAGETWLRDDFDELPEGFAEAFGTR